MLPPGEESVTIPAKAPYSIIVSPLPPLPPSCLMWG